MSNVPNGTASHFMDTEMYGQLARRAMLSAASTGCIIGWSVISYFWMLKLAGPLSNRNLKCCCEQVRGVVPWNVVCIVSPILAKELPKRERDPSAEMDAIVYLNNLLYICVLLNIMGAVLTYWWSGNRMWSVCMQPLSTYI